MPSFDLVSRLDAMELQNALLTTEKTINGRFDFKGSEAKAEYKEKDKLIEIRAEDETKVKAIRDILMTNMGKRGLGLKGLEESPIEATGMKMKKMTIKMVSGIDKEKAKIINKLLKEAGSKVKSQYMDEKFRLESKNIDDLQSAFQLLKTSKELNIDLQMENMKR
ncbi:MAG: YajQ family cyclic di-GMP-binding protein [Bacteriovoracaceae bacterium]|nr:YajQ family cyclic di-GMP-binding protein [Bacteriovoracaceae bacterium]